MLVARTRLFAATLSSVAALGCADVPSAEDERVSERRQPIISGSLDFEHDAVMVYQAAARCSAIVFRVEGEAGYALTAGHCADDALGTLLEGDDYEVPVQTYAVVEQAVHPLYHRALSFDIAVLRFKAEPETPWLPLLDARTTGLVLGDDLALVGYGLTHEGPSTLRHAVTRPLMDVAPTRLLFDQSVGGFCSGDSGGPVLATTPNGEVAAGIMQSVIPDCYGVGLAGPIALVQDTFITPFIEGRAPKLQTCSECAAAVTFAGSACEMPAKSCALVPSCAAYAACREDCADASCFDACEADHPLGATEYQQTAQCLCASCANECEAQPACEGVAVDFGSAALEPGEPEPGPVVVEGCSVAAGGERGRARRLEGLWLALVGLVAARRRRQGFSGV